MNTSIQNFFYLKKVFTVSLFALSLCWCDSVFASENSDDFIQVFTNSENQKMNFQRTQETKVETEDNQREDNQKKIDSPPQNSNNNNTQQDHYLLIPSGALDNKEEEKLVYPPQTFQEKILDPELQENTLKEVGLQANETQKKEKFENPDKIADLIEKDLWGASLCLEKAAFQTAKEFIIFDSFVKTKSLRKLDLTNSYLPPKAFIALCNGIIRNQSLRTLDLTGVNFNTPALTLVGTAIAEHKSLKKLVLKAKFEAIPQQKALVNFYGFLQKNTRLRLILWPDACVSNLKKIFWWAKNTPEYRVIIFHQGIYMAEGVYYDKDLPKAIGTLQKAYELGHPEAAYEIATLLRTAKNTKEALEWYEKSKAQGCVRALVHLGDFHRRVWHKLKACKQIVPAPNYEKAYDAYQVAAERSNRKAMYKLGRMYEKGRYVAQNLDKAGDLYFQACQKGNPDAFAALGALYQNKAYSGYNLKAAKRYLKWGLRYDKSRAPSTRLLSYAQQEEEKQNNNNNNNN